MLFSGKGRFYLPILFATAILLLPYALRNVLIAPLALRVAENAASRSFERRVSLDVRGFSGSWIWDISLEAVSFDYGEGPFPVNSASVEGLSLRYDPFELFEVDPVAVVSSVSVSGLRVLLNREPTVEKIEEEIEEEPEIAIRDLRRLLRRDARTPSVSIDGEVFFADSEEQDPIGVSIDGNLEDVLRVELSGSDDVVALDFSQLKNGVRVLTDRRATSLEIDLSAEVVAPVSPASSIAGSVRIDSAPLSIEVVTWGRRLEFSARVTEELADRLEQWSRRFSRDLTLLPPSIEPGTAVVEGVLTLKQGFPPDFLSLALSSTVSPQEAVTGQVSLSASGWSYRGSPETAVELDASWEDPAVAFRVGHLAVDAGSIGSITVEDAEIRPTRLLPVTQLSSLRVTVSNLEAALRLAGVEDFGGIAAGVSGTFDASADGFELEVSGSEANQAIALSLSARGDGFLQGRVDSGSFDISLPDESSGETLGPVTASGSFSGHLFGAEGEVAPEVRLRIENLSMPPVVASGAEGRLDSLTGELSVTGPPEHPRIDLEFAAGRLRLGDERIAVEGRIIQDERSVVVRSLDAEDDQGGQAVSLMVAGRLPIAVGSGGVSLRNLRSSSLTIDGRVVDLGRFVPEEARLFLPRGTTEIEGRLLEDSGDLAFRLAAEGERTEDEREEAPLGYSNVTASLRVVEGAQDRIDTEVVLRLDDRDVLRQTGSLTMPGLVDAEPSWTPDEVRLASDVEIDLPLSIVPTLMSSFVYSEGRLQGKLTTQGAPGSLEHEGRLEVVDGGARFAGPLPVLTAVNGEIRLRGLEIVAESITGELGRSPFAASGAFDLDDKSLEVTLEGENLLIVSQQGIRIRSDVDLAASGTLSNLEITGALRLTEGQYTQNVPLVRFDTVPTVNEEAIQVFSVPGDFGASTSLNVEATAENSFLVANNVYRGSLSADVRLSGNLQVPIVTGRVFADSGTVRLPVTDLGLTNISFEFPEEQPFSPRLQAQGETQIRDYTVFVNAYGTIPAIEVQVSSSPPLPQEQAILLLTTGHADLDALGEGQRSVVTAGRFVGRQLASFLFGPDQAGDAAGFDRVEIAVGRRLSQEGNEVVEVDFRLGSGERWYLEFERDEFDHYNLGLAWRFSFR